MRLSSDMSVVIIRNDGNRTTIMIDKVDREKDIAGIYNFKNSRVNNYRLSTLEKYLDRFR
jgi:hypothetical protein